MAYIHNPHPGEILKEEFLDEFGISQNELGRAIDAAKSYSRYRKGRAEHYSRYRFAFV